MSTPLLSLCELFEVYLQQPEVSVGEEEDRREAGLITPAEDV